MSIPPRTHCSAARSCGGVRSNSSPRGAISVTLIGAPSPIAAAFPRPPARPLNPFYRTAPTVLLQRPPASSDAVHRPVDSLCRHAAVAVRSMGIALWICRLGSREECSCLGLCLPPVVRRKKSCPGRPSTMAGSYPHWEFHVQRYMRAPRRPRCVGRRCARLGDSPVPDPLWFDHVFDYGRADRPDLRGHRGAGGPPG